MMYYFFYFRYIDYYKDLWCIFVFILLEGNGGGSGAKGTPTLVGPKREHLGGKERGERWV
jgi:hypothetical protein